MMRGVIVHDIQSLNMMPSIGAMIGNVHSPEVLERLNMASGGGVVFGQPGDPYADRYAALKNILMSNLQVADQTVTQAKAAVYDPERMVPLTNIDAMREVPPCMKLPIVTYAPVRTLLEAGRISGFGIDPRFLPDEDVYGRLIDNGKVRIDKKTKEVEFSWHWQTDDPRLTDGDLEAIEQTREWIDNWLYNEMKPGGSYIDPTDPENLISKKK